MIDRARLSDPRAFRSVWRYDVRISRSDDLTASLYPAVHDRISPRDDSAAAAMDRRSHPAMLCPVCRAVSLIFSHVVQVDLVSSKVRSASSNGFLVPLGLSMISPCFVPPGAYRGRVVGPCCRVVPEGPMSYHISYVIHVFLFPYQAMFQFSTGYYVIALGCVNDVFRFFRTD